MQLPTPTPSPAEVVELLDKAEQVIDIWNSLGPLMAVLLLAGLSILGILAVIYFNRGGSSTAIRVLENVSTRQDREIDDLKKQSANDNQETMKSLMVIGEQMTRSNDLWEASNIQAGQRVSQQQRMVDVTAQAAADLKTIATVGSAPVQEIKAKVGEIFGIVTRIDSQTADWNGILQVLTPLLVELGALRTEAKKHSTQPLPPITDMMINADGMEPTNKSGD